MAGLDRGKLISSCRAKIARADEHLAALYAETDAWGDLDPLTLERSMDVDGRVHDFRVRISPRPDTWRWAMLLGDALHNLRCALDHIVYAMAIAHTGDDPPNDDRHLAFPLAPDAEQFAKSKWRLRSLRPEAQLAIEKVQPYNRLRLGRTFAPLWWLGQLDDVDKHRAAHVTPVAGVPKDSERNRAPSRRCGTRTCCPTALPSSGSSWTSPTVASS